MEAVSYTHLDVSKRQVQNVAETLETMMPHHGYCRAPTHYLQDNTCLLYTSLRLETLPIPIERPARHGFDACVTLDEVYTVFAVSYTHL